MLNSAILEVIIGMVFIYSLLSILVTQMNTLISTGLNLGARNLRVVLKDMLKEPKVQAKIFAHPTINLIRDVFIEPKQQLKTEEAVQIASKTPLNRVTWIKKDTFSETLLNVLMETCFDNMRTELFDEVIAALEKMPAGTERNTLRLLIKRLLTTGKGFAELEAFLDALETTYQQAYEADPTMQPAPALKALRKLSEELASAGLEYNDLLPLLFSISKLENKQLKASLTTLISAAKDVEDARRRIENWFDEWMSRATQRFTRYMRGFSLGIGFLIAVLLNADSLHMGRTLWQDPSLRELVAQTATNAANPEAAPTTDAEAVPTVEEPSSEATPPEEAANATPNDLQTAVDETRTTIDNLLALGLPLGWEHYNPLVDRQTGERLTLSASEEARLRKDMRNLWNFYHGNPDEVFWRLFEKTIGILLTMIAIAQGAPFWFDLLNRLTSSRSPNEKG